MVSYAPEEVSDIQKAASAMKAKAGRDMIKLKNNQLKIAAVLSGLPVERWILLCPFLDDVIAHPLGPFSSAPGA